VPSAARRAVSATSAAAVAAVLAAAPGGAVAAPADPAPAPVAGAAVEVEISSPEHGTAAGSSHILVPRKGQDRSRPRLSEARLTEDGLVTKVVDSGEPADRLDAVVIGDGYTAAELPRFHADARAIWERTAAVEPYATHRDLRNVWAIDAVVDRQVRF
jgi:hypothetical protein